MFCLHYFYVAADFIQSDCVDYFMTRIWSYLLQHFPHSCYCVIYLGAVLFASVVIVYFMKGIWFSW